MWVSSAVVESERKEGKSVRVVRRRHVKFSLVPLTDSKAIKTAGQSNTSKYHIYTQQQ